MIWRLGAVIARRNFERSIGGAFTTVIRAYAMERRGKAVVTVIGH
jgi:hypothetical protein